MTYGIGNKGPGLGQAQKCGSRLINPPPLITDNTDINKPAQIHFHSKRTHTITKMNDKINMDSTIAGSVNVHS